MGVDYSENKDLWQTFHDLSHMGVEHRDIRYTNILCAPLAPPGFRGAKCPYHKRVHEFRIIDFDRWVKSDYNMEGHERTTVCSMGGLLEGISKGYKVEPWATWRLFSFPCIVFCNSECVSRARSLSNKNIGRKSTDICIGVVYWISLGI